MVKQSCKGSRESARGLNSKQRQQLQKPPLNHNSLLQLADNMAEAILEVAMPLLCAGLANSPE
jgi:hypothetical protein